jgi:hypothetical protein
LAPDEEAPIKNEGVCEHFARRHEQIEEDEVESLRRILAPDEEAPIKNEGVCEQHMTEIFEVMMKYGAKRRSKKVAG